MKRNLKFALAALALFSILIFKSCALDRATWYGEPHRGKLMANGKRFNPDALTAASWHHPLGSKVKVIYGEKSVVVEITDRGASHDLFRGGESIDLSRAAFSRLADPQRGSIKVKIVRVN